MKPYNVEATREGISIRDASGRVVVSDYWRAFSSAARNLDDIRDGVGFRSKDIPEVRREIARQIAEFDAMCEGLNLASIEAPAPEQGA